MSELWKRLGFLAFALLVYRIGTHIPIPGINPEQVAALFQQSQGTILQYFNLFSGGALERMSIFALSVVPYISAAIVMQLFSNSLPYLQELKKDGQAGRNKITQYTRYGTVVFALIQSTALTVTLQTAGLIESSSIFGAIVAVLSIVTGTVFLMWLGEQISERGIGNGISPAALDLDGEGRVTAKDKQISRAFGTASRRSNNQEGGFDDRTHAHAFLGRA